MIPIHSYATDSNERNTIAIILALLSVFIAWGIHIILLNNNIEIPWWFDAPSPIGIYFILYELFNKFIWKLCHIGPVHLVKIPDISGEWEGEILSSYDNHNRQYDVKVTIEQNWTQMIMKLRTDRSESKTVTSAFDVMQSNEPILSYIYYSTPRGNAVNTMQAHSGTGILKLTLNNELDGDYYTGRGRETHGRLNLRRRRL